MDDSETLIEVEIKFPIKNFHFIKSDDILNKTEKENFRTICIYEPKCYKYRGTPEQLKHQSKIKILSAKVSVIDEE